MRYRTTLGIAAVLLSSACAMTGGGARHVGTVTVVSAHETLVALDDAEKLVVCGRPSAPAAPACVSVEENKVISAKLAQAFEHDAALARTVRDWPATSAPPASVGELLSKIREVVAYVLAHLPDGPVKAKLVAKLGGA